MNEMQNKTDRTAPRSIFAEIIRGLLTDLLYFAFGAGLGAVGGALTMAFYVGATSGLALAIGAIGGAIVGLAVLGFARGFFSL